MNKLSCQDYIFLLTSGQLEEARVLLRLRAAHHRLICRYCRAFTSNDEALDRIIGQHNARLQTLQPDPTSTAEGGASNKSD